MINNSDQSTKMPVEHWKPPPPYFRNKFLKKECGAVDSYALPRLERGGGSKSVDSVPEVINPAGQPIIRNKLT